MPKGLTQQQRRWVEWTDMVVKVGEGYTSDAIVKLMFGFNWHEYKRSKNSGAKIVSNLPTPQKLAYALRVSKRYEKRLMPDGYRRYYWRRIA